MSNDISMMQDNQGKAVHTDRREYKRLWMARRRAQIRESGKQKLTVSIPAKLAKALKESKPVHLSWAVWVAKCLRRGLSPAQGRTVAPHQPGPTSSNLTPAPSHSANRRNAPCSCGSGKKFKNCCGKPF